MGKSRGLALTGTPELLQQHPSLGHFPDASVGFRQDFCCSPLWCLHWEVVPGIHRLHVSSTGECLGFSELLLSGPTLLSSISLRFGPHPLLRETHFLRGSWFVFLMLPCCGQDGIRLLFIPKGGLLPSLGSCRLEHWAAAPTPGVGAPFPYSAEASPSMSREPPVPAELGMLQGPLCLSSCP